MGENPQIFPFFRLNKFKKICLDITAIQIRTRAPYLVEAVKVESSNVNFINELLDLTDFNGEIRNILSQVNNELLKGPQSREVCFWKNLKNFFINQQANIYPA